MTVTHSIDCSERTSTGPVVARALRLIEAFSDDRPTLTLSEIR